MAVRPVFWIRTVPAPAYAGSRVGAPNERLAVPGMVVARATVVAAAAAWTSPAPPIRGSYAAIALAEAVFMIAAFTCSGVHRGCAWMTRAATPATCGVDIDVPDSRTPSVPVPTAAEKTDKPGAEMSGLRLPSAAGPPDEKSATARNAGLARAPLAAMGVVGPARTLRAAAPDGFIPRNGIVTRPIAPTSGGRR